MVKGKKKLKQTKIVNEDVTQIRNLIIILVVVVAVCTGLYFLTDTMIKKENNKEEETTEIEFDYNIASVGTMFNRPESEYFVLIYSTENDGSKYNSLLDTYRSSDNYVKTYFIDLDKKINSHILTEELNKKPKNSKEVSVKGATLYKIKGGKVTNCYSTLETITDALK